MKSKQFFRTDEAIIDAELKVKIFRSAQSKFWYVQFNDPNHGQRRKSLKTQSKKEARHRAAKYATAVASGTTGTLKKRRTPIQEAVDARMERLRNKLKRKPKTLASHRCDYEKLVNWAANNTIRFLDQLSEHRMESLEHILGTTGVALKPRELPSGKSVKGVPPSPLGHGTLRRTMKNVRGLLRFALRRQMLDMDPCPEYDLPEEVPAAIDIYSANERHLIFADPDPLSNVWRFFFETGVRREEFCWLQKVDVVVDASGRPMAILIRPKSCPLTGALWDPKHGKERRIPLSAAMAEIVRQWLATHGTPWLFPSPGSTSRAGRWDGEVLLDRLRQHLARVGIKHGGLHTFRHTCATYLANNLEAPMPLALLQDFLGHSSIATTQRYLHAQVQDVQAAVARVNFTPAITDGAHGDGNDGLDGDATQKEGGSIPDESVKVIKT